MLIVAETSTFDSLIYITPFLTVTDTTVAPVLLLIKARMYMLYHSVNCGTERLCRSIEKFAYNEDHV